MDITEFDKKIDDFDVEIKSLRDKAEKEAASFISDSGPRLAEFARDTAVRFVKEKAENTTKIGASKLSEFKKELVNYCEGLPQIVSGRLNSDELWSHRGEINPDPSTDERLRFSIYGNRMPDHLERVFREILDPLAKLLDRYGYRSNMVQYGRATHSFHFKWSGQQISIINAYDEILRQLIQVANARARVAKEKAQAQAEDLWNSV